MNITPPPAPLIPPQAPPDFSAVKRKPVWPWLVGGLIPIVFFGAFIGFSTISASLEYGFVAEFIEQFFGIFFVLALGPMVVASAIGIPGMRGEGFVFITIPGLLLSGFVWVLIGRGMYALYRSRFKIIFWLLIFGVIVASGIGAYIITSRKMADVRAMEQARETKDVSYCDRFEGETRDFCIVGVAVAANDPTICERVVGDYPRVSCFNSLNVPYTPPAGMK